MAGLSAFLLVGSSSAAAQGPGTHTTFNYTGAPQSYTVPPGVTEVTVKAFGAQGASTDYDEGGFGGEALGVVQVTPGEVLQVYVGGQGGVGEGNGGVHLNGGWNGGAFGSPNDNSNYHSTGGGGGGASDVRQAGAPCPHGTCADAAEQDAQYNRVVIAGGGGGAGSADEDGGACGGGGGGGLEGLSGNDPDNGCDEGGGGGTQTSGGSGGQGGWSSGQPGTRYMGGSAGGFGGGGGGGLYGGGGGGTEKRTFFGVESPKLGSGGGGGSSYILDPQGTTTPFQRAGNGLVVISYYLSMTQNPSNGVLGSAITNTATLSTGNSPTGTIYFNAYGPDDTTCGNDPVFTDTVTVSGNGDYTSGDFTPTSAGTYSWDVEYSGDAENYGFSLDCEGTSIVAPASPALSTTASNGTLGDPIRDTASLAGGQGPTGQLTFNAYEPGDTNCARTPAFSHTASVSGNGDYTSADFTPIAPGAYRWTAHYSGDSNNDPASSACNAANGTSTVWLAAPLLSTSASAGVVIGGSINDTATLSHGQSPSGTIEFALYGPDDAECAGTPVFTDTVNVNSGNGAYRSADFTPSSAGTYRWVARYSGDADDDPAAGACNDPNESVSVAKRSPTIAPVGSGDVVLGGSVYDTATIAGGSAPTGEVTFSLYGPGDVACSGPPVFTDAVSANSGSGSYDSATFTPAEAGTYHWIAVYSGDADNDGATSACSDSGVSVTVSPPDFEITGVEVDRTGGTATLDVESNAAGALWIAKTHKVNRTDTATLTEAGSVELEVVLRAAAARTLRREGQLTVNPRILFGPTTGGQLGERQMLNLRLD